MSSAIPVQKLLSIEKGEFAKAFLLFLYLFFMTAATIIGRTAADTMFLSKFDLSNLSYMYLAISISLSFFGIIYHRIVDRFRKDRLTYVVTTLLIALVIGSRLALDMDIPLIYPLIFVGYEVFNFLLILQFWTFTNDILDTRQAKRLLGFIGSAGILGGMASGFGIKGVVGYTGTANLIYLYAGFMAVCLILVQIIAHREFNELEIAARTEKKKPAKSEQKSIRNIFHLKLIAVSVGIITMVLIFIDYQFKVIITRYYQNEELAAFLGQFYGYTGIIALGFQLFLSSKILSKLGILVSLLILPVFLLLSSLTLLFADSIPGTLAFGSLAVTLIPVLTAAVFAKSNDKIFSDTIYSSASQLMYVPLHANIRGRAKVFIDGIIKPLSKGLGAVLLILSVHFYPVSVQEISWAVVISLLICIVVMFMVKNEYMKSLFSTLTGHQIDFKNIDFNVSDSSTISILVNGLESTDDRRALYCLDALKNIEGFYLIPHLLMMLVHPSPGVRVEALKILETITPPDARADVLRLLDERDEGVKVQAILTLAAYGDDENMKRLLAFLLDENLEVKGAAIAGLMQHYGIDGIFYSVDIFKQMMGSLRIDERKEVARIIGRIGAKNFYKPLVKLLEDPSKEVQAYAIEAAKRLKVVDLIPNIIKKLKQKETRLKAIEALAGYDHKEIVPELKTYLEFSSKYKDISLYVPRIFELMASQECADILIDNYERSAPYLRSKILDSLAKMRLRVRDLNIPAETNQKLIELELGEHKFFSQCLRAVRPFEGIAILIEAINNVRHQILGRLFKLLSFEYDSKIMMTVFHNLSGQEKRVQANAVEILDNLLKGDLKDEVLDVVSRISSEEKPGARDAELLFETLAELFKKENDWIKMVIEFVSMAPKLEELDGNRCFALKKMIQESKVDYDRRELVNVIQKVAILRKVSFFAGLTGEYLSNIAVNMQGAKALKGEAVFQEGDPGDSFYIIIKGKVLVHKKDVPVVELESGQCVGEMAILDNERRSTSVTALEDTIMFELESDTFYDIIADKIEIAKGVIRMLSMRLRQQLAKIAGGKPPVTERSEQDVDMNMSMADTELDTQALLKRILILKEINLFSSLSDGDTLLLANLIEEVTYKKGQDIFLEGDTGDAMYGISRGAVLVHKGNKELAVLGEKEYFGEMAVLDNEPRSASITALKDTTLLKLTSDDFYSLLFDKIEITKSIFAMLVKRLRETMEAK